MFLTSLRNRCSQLEEALYAKAPPDSAYLVYVTLNIEVRARAIEYRLSASLWKAGAPSDDSAFKAYHIGDNPFALLHKLARDIEVFELWTPAAIAATLGIVESV